VELRRETHISTIEAGAQAPSRVPRPHGDQGRSGCLGTSSRQGAEAFVCIGMAVPLSRLTVRHQFLHVAQGQRASGRYLFLQGRAVSDAGAGARIGFTASKKVGNAVARNRSKRRLRDAVRAVFSILARPGWDYVVVAKTEAISAPWPDLVDDLEKALIRLHRAPEGRSGAKTPPPVEGVAVSPEGSIRS